MNPRKMGVLIVVAAMVIIAFSAPRAIAKGLLTSPGTWKATTGFGGFTFVVNPGSTGISAITFNFSKYSCGPSRLSGKISVEKKALWPIIKRTFTIETNLKLYRIIIKGNFDEDGRHAHGTWQIVSLGKTCEGAWEGGRVKGQRDKR